MPAESGDKIVSVKRVKQGEAEQSKIKQYVVDSMQKKTGV
jgi:hypothetical protein